jgi:nicotinamide-nucleotide amidase
MSQSPTKCDAEILTIGDELNRGEIVDTNSAWLAGRLTELGAHVRWRSSVTDDEPDMEKALAQAANRARVVVCSGGLGPTDDDRTVDVVSRLLGVEPVLDPFHEEKMHARFSERGFTLTPNNLRQVRIPKGAEVLENRTGLAPGFRVRLGPADLYFMPGVPREMKGIFDHQVVPRLGAILGTTERVARRTWRVAGMGESHVDHAMRGILDGVQGATLHFRIAFPECLVTVVVRRPDELDARSTLERLDADVRARLAGNVYGIDDETLPQVVGRDLSHRSATVAVAESCTGGLVGQLLTAVPGSSAYFKGGVISYANETKQSLLGVSAATLEAHGAVSRETVLEMAAGARRVLGTTWAVAISGIAGPDGGTADKPVGTVHLAVAGEGVAEHRHLYWPPRGKDGREQVRQLAAFGALHLLHKTLTR